MTNYINKLEPNVKQAFVEAMCAANCYINENMQVVLFESINKALTDYMEAARLQGYFNALGDMIPEVRTVFYTAATCMIHFKYYHWNEKEN